MSSKTIDFKYKFKFAYDNEKEFDLSFDAETMELIKEKKIGNPPWTQLKRNQCENCPLSTEEHEHCPAAVGIADIVDFFANPLPQDDVEITVTTPFRTYSKTVTLQSATSSIIGIIMATSGCPIMQKLRPMARYHLPFATADETVYRAMATYLIHQYFKMQNGDTPDWDMEGLNRLYGEVEQVNAAFHQRLQEIGKSAPSLGAILTLDCFAYYMNLSLSGNKYYYIENLFKTPEINSLENPDAVMENKGSTTDITYKFILEDGMQKTFPIKINTDTILNVKDSDWKPGEWTKLTCKKCTNCPLDEAQHEYCPAALSIDPVIDYFKDAMSIQKAEVSVETEHRTYGKSTDLQTGISGIMGLLMATSGCPVLSELKPMVYSHLPFSTIDESIYRTLSMYLIAQYFVMKKGGEPDWKLENLPVLFEKINGLNKDFISRLRENNLEDASLNALTKLDCFATSFKFSMESDYFADLQKLYNEPAA